MIEFSSSGNDHSPTHESPIVNATRAWLEKAVIGLNLCPFAKAVHVKRQIRYAVSNAKDVRELAEDLRVELELLAEADSEALDTTLLIHPQALADFFEYNDFLPVADAVVESLGLEGVIQVASFHPRYQFADSEEDDIENFTNRSPFPVLHLLREDSISRAVASTPDASDIYERNMATLRELGHEGWKQLGFDSDKSHE